MSGRCWHPRLPTNLSPTMHIFHAHYKTSRITSTSPVWRLFSSLFHISSPATNIRLALYSNPVHTFHGHITHPADSPVPLLPSKAKFTVSYTNRWRSQTCSSTCDEDYALCWLDTPSAVPFTTPPANQLILPLYFIIKQFTNETSLLLCWANNRFNFST